MRRRKKSSFANFEFNNLEPRQMLAGVVNLDINTTPVPFGLPYRSDVSFQARQALPLIEFNGSIMYSAHDGAGTELWFNDGTPTGNELADLVPGPDSSELLDGVKLNGKVILGGYSGLYLSDGTPGGTSQFTDKVSRLYSKFSVWNDKAYFIGRAPSDNTQSSAIFETNGTPEGTREIFDLTDYGTPTRGGAESFLPVTTVVNGHFIFGLRDSSFNGRRFYSLNIENSSIELIHSKRNNGNSELVGTESFGNVEVLHIAELNTGASVSWISKFVVTDGTQDGTRELSYSAVGGSDNISGRVARSGNHFLFNERNLGLVKLDPLTGETTDFNVEKPNEVEFATGPGERQYFISAKVGGRTLLRYVENGELHDVVEVPFWSSPFAQDGETFYFMTGSSGSLWVSDGTELGTQMVYDFSDTDWRLSNIKHFDGAILNGRLYFYLFNQLNRNVLWVSDGTELGTLPIEEPSELTYGTYTAKNFGSPSVTFNDSVIYATQFYREEKPYRLISTDGTKANTYEFASFDEQPKSLIRLGDKFYFHIDGVFWKSDGTSEGTEPFQTFDKISIYRDSYVYEDKLYFFADNKQTGELGIWLLEAGREQAQFLASTSVNNQLAITSRGDVFFGDGAKLFKWVPASSQLVLVRELDYEFASISNLNTVDDRLFFSANVSQDEQSRPWVSDGTEAGTRVLLDGDTRRAPFHVFNGHAYFAINDREQHYSVWRANGTEDAELFFDLQMAHWDRPGFESAGNSLFMVFRTISSTGSFGRSLYVSDGTTENTTFIGEPEFDSIVAIEFQDEVYFTGYTQEVGGELFRTNGTPEGTELVVDIIPGHFGSRPSFLGALENVLVFETQQTSGAYEANPYLFPISRELFAYDPNITDDIEVTSTADSGPGSLRQAIIDSNQKSGTQNIVFDLPADSIIQVTSGLPAITDTIIIDGTQHPDYVESPVIAVQPVAENGPTRGFTVRADDSIIKGLAIGGFDFNGIDVLRANDVMISENFIGFSVDTMPLGNNQRGVRIWNSNRTQVLDNVIANNRLDGLFVVGDSRDSMIASNRIGTDPTGQLDYGNGTAGIQIRSGYTNVIDNLIAGNDWTGIAINGTTSVENTIDGNVIGLAADDTELGNSGYGVLSRAPDNVIQNNTIAGNSHYGVFLQRADRQQLLGNRIGINQNEEAVANRGGGIRSLSSGEVRIDDNTISGNRGAGIHMTGSESTDIRISNNRIGTDSTGMLDVGNTGYGLHFHTVFGATIQENTISGNDGGGVYSVGNSSSLYLGNYIGVAADGISALHNSLFGMWIGSDAMLDQIGSLEKPNVLSDAFRPIALVGSAENRIEYNFIGTDARQTENLGGLYGILLQSNAANNTISQNYFDHTSIAIRNISQANGNRFSSNSMGEGVLTGIDNGSLGLQENDSGDLDEGPNRMQNSPEFTGFTRAQDGKLEFQYRVDTLGESASFPLTVELYLANQNRVGMQMLASATYNLGDDIQSIFYEGDIRSGSQLVLLTFDADGNTSEFSEFLTI